MDYLIVKSLHILSSTFLFGTGIGSAFYMLFANVSGDFLPDGRQASLSPSSAILPRTLEYLSLGLYVVFGYDGSNI